jgi:CIC family chloride channel protein
VYSLKLRRRGVDLGVRETIEAAHVPVRQVMQPVPPTLPADLPLPAAADRLARSAYGVLPVADRDGTHLGVLTASAVAEALADGRHDAAPAQLLVDSPAPLREHQDIDDGIEALERSGCGAIPVLATDIDDVVGWFDYRNAISTLGASTR